jgi:CHAT domain-containing protein/Tfp pilus assembly protein PilF
MFRSFLDTRKTQAHLTGQLGRSKSYLEHLVLLYLIATLLAFNLFTPMVISAQTHDKTRSDAEALAEAVRLDEEVFRLYQAGRAKEALPLAKRALSINEKVLGPEHRDTALSLNNLGFLLKAMGDLRGAKPYYERALAICEKVLGPEHPDTARNLNNLGALLKAMGDLRGAKPYYERALAICEKVLGPEHRDTALILNNLGGLLKAMGDLRGAKPYYGRALAICEKVLGPEHPHTASILNNLGGLLQAMGDLKGAKPYLDRALAIREKVLGPEHPDTAQSINNLGGLLKDMGDLKGAKPYWERALAIREKVLGPEHPDTALSINNLGGLLYAMGDLRGAKTYYERALAIFEKVLGPEHPDTALSLNSLGGLLKDMGDLKGAKPYWERALAIREKVLGPEHPDTALSINNLGFLLQAMGDIKGAKPYYERALAIFEKVLGPEHPHTALSLNNLAALHWAMGDIAQAVTFSGRAQNAQEKSLAATLSIGSEAQKQALLQTLIWSSHSAVSLHVDAARRDRRATRLALTTVLRRKGRALDATVEGLRILREHLSPEHGALFDRLADLRAQRAYLLLRPPEALRSEARRALIAELNPQISKIEAQLSVASAAFQQAHIPVTLEAVQAMIPAKTALVEFFVYKPCHVKARDSEKRWGDPHYVAYVLQRTGEPAWVPLGEARRIEAAAEAFRRSVAERRGDVRQRGRDLDYLTLGKVRPLLGEASVLLISPDGVLNLVPFAALVDERGQYLIERYRLSYLTSGRDLLRVAAGAPEREAPLILGDASFGGSFGPSGARGEGKRAADMGSLQFGPLPGTAKEVRAIGGILGLPANRILTKEAATEGVVKGVKGPRILHLATHGFFLPDLPEAPVATRQLGWGGTGPGASAFAASAGGYRLTDPLLRSGLALSGFNRRQEAKGANDGVLTALEVLGLDLWGTEEVVLSACETGVGEVRAGEGVFGLRRALVLAGAQSELMTLWQVEDEPTKELMVSWYSQLQKGIGRMEALYRAQLAALRGEALPVTNARLRGVKLEDRAEQGADPSVAGSRHPYYWASFILSGATGPISTGK